ARCRQAPARLLDRWTWHLHMGTGHAGCPPASRGVRVPAELRTRPAADERSPCMSRLRIYEDARADAPLATWTDPADIARELAVAGVRFEQWEAGQPIVPGASQDEVIAAYRSDIDRLMREEGYRAVDVVSLTPDHPDRATLRGKFLDEHTHSE